jgi:hypothetical protein
MKKTALFLTMILLMAFTTSAFAQKRFKGGVRGGAVSSPVVVGAVGVGTAVKGGGAIGGVAARLIPHKMSSGVECCATCNSYNGNTCTSWGQCEPGTSGNSVGCGGSQSPQ